jgi:hypothetical protein
MIEIYQDHTDIIRITDMQGNKLFLDRSDMEAFKVAVCGNTTKQKIEIKAEFDIAFDLIAYLVASGFDVDSKQSGSVWTISAEKEKENVC